MCATALSTGWTIHSAATRMGDQCDDAEPPSLHQRLSFTAEYKAPRLTRCAVRQPPDNQSEVRLQWPLCGTQPAFSRYAHPAYSASPYTGRVANCPGILQFRPVECAIRPAVISHHKRTALSKQHQNAGVRTPCSGRDQPSSPHRLTGLTVAAPFPAGEASQPRGSPASRWIGFASPSLHQPSTADQDSSKDSPGAGNVSKNRQARPNQSFLRKDNPLRYGIHTDPVGPDASRPRPVFTPRRRCVASHRRPPSQFTHDYLGLHFAAIARPRTY